jgi:hypothetical protein
MILTGSTVTRTSTPVITSSAWCRTTLTSRSLPDRLPVCPAGPSSGRQAGAVPTLAVRARHLSHGNADREPPVGREADVDAWSGKPQRRAEIDPVFVGEGDRPGVTGQVTGAASVGHPGGPGLVAGAARTVKPVQGVSIVRPAAAVIPMVNEPGGCPPAPGSGGRGARRGARRDAGARSATPAQGPAVPGIRHLRPVEQARQPGHRPRRDHRDHPARRPRHPQPQPRRLPRHRHRPASHHGGSEQRPS